MTDEKFALYLSIFALIVSGFVLYYTASNYYELKAKIDRRDAHHKESWERYLQYRNFDVNDPDTYLFPTIPDSALNDTNHQTFIRGYQNFYERDSTNQD